MISMAPAHHLTAKEESWLPTIGGILAGDLKDSRKGLLISIAKWPNLLSECLGDEEDADVLSLLGKEVEGGLDV